MWAGHVVREAGHVIREGGVMRGRRCVGRSCDEGGEVCGQVM